MSFLSPLALAAFALSLPLVLLYFIKVRRRERRVSSLMFWEAVQRWKPLEWQVTLPWQQERA